jgi:hypothetical protein
MPVVAGTPTVIINNFNVFEAIVPLTLSGSYPGIAAGDPLSLIGIVPSNSVPIFVDIQEEPAAGTLASGVVWKFAPGTTQANGALQAFIAGGVTATGTVTIPIGTNVGTTSPVYAGNVANTFTTTGSATSVTNASFTGSATSAAALANLGNVTYASVSAGNLVARVVYKKYV